MKFSFNSFFLFVLAVILLLTVGVIWYNNSTYYLTSMEERPFHSQYDLLKPTGIVSHGYGIVGTAMILTGVILYSTRKRIKRFSQLGQIKYFLEFHIFLCLLGPSLIVYHTTFKFGGLVGVSFWSMTAVVLSGIIGRYLYRFIPKNIEGNELSKKDLQEEEQKLTGILRKQYHLPDEMIEEINRVGSNRKQGNQSNILRFFMSLLQADFTRFRELKRIRRILSSRHTEKSVAEAIVHIARKKIILEQRLAVLERIQYVFHYWHVVHLPFTIIMGVILLVHIGVAIAFGYTWIF
jgi:hypothetical protein